MEYWKEALFGGLFISFIIGTATTISTCQGQMTECRMLCAKKGYIKSDIIMKGRGCYCDLDSKSNFKKVEGI